ncbi:transposon-encoded TnpW family protein [Tannockella kyphosi]|uniref:transposon-encoded TnpW family protein n=1 Tax=Tannockella kyphosi TaxID=2899121 RepID=UPI002013A24F|nr:transposon-encoded TnpW family protein [Tannockella kyphosi]
MENQTLKQDTNTKNRFKKKIGKTIYEVTVYSSQTSKETLQDKMERLIENECVSIVNQE